MLPEFCSVPRYSVFGGSWDSPLALIPSAFRDGGQFWDVSVAVQVLGSSPGHDPLQPSVVGFAAFRRGVVWQTQGHTLAPKQELAVPNLEPKHSSAAWILDRRQERHTSTFKKTLPPLMGCCTGFKMVPVNSSLFTGHKVNGLKRENLFPSAQPEIWSADHVTPQSG